MVVCFLIQLSADGKDDGKTPHSSVKCAYNEMRERLQEECNFVRSSYYLIGRARYLDNSGILCQLFIRGSKNPLTKYKIVRASA